MQQQIPLPIIDLSRCDGCGLCVKACPHGALAMRDGKPVIVKPDACDYDGTAEMICPKQAIRLPYEIVYVDETEES